MVAVSHKNMKITSNLPWDLPSSLELSQYFLLFNYWNFQLYINLLGWKKNLNIQTSRKSLPISFHFKYNSHLPSQKQLYFLIHRSWIELQLILPCVLSVQVSHLDKCNDWPYIVLTVLKILLKYQIPYLNTKHFI